MFSSPDTRVLCGALLMKALFHWLDQHPDVYVLLAMTALVVTLAGLLRATLRATLRAGRERAPGGDGRAWLGWAACFALLLLAWRWPMLLDPKPLNPDEASFVATAIKLEHDPRFWRSIDNTTSGPLASLPLLALRWTGLPPDYFNARLVAILLAAGALSSTLLALRRLCGPWSATAGFLPSLGLLCVTLDWDFVHYNSEILPIFLLSLAVWLIALGRDDGFTGPRWWAAGALLGLLPWAKLQSAPIGLAVGAWAVGWALLRPDVAWPRRWRRAGEIVVAAAAPSVVLLLIHALSGQLNHWWMSFVVDNLAYAAAMSYTLGLDTIFRIASFTYGLHAFLVAPCLLLAVGLSWSRQLHRRPAFWLGVAGTVSAAYAITASGRGFLHYVMFFILPLGWLCAACLRDWLERPAGQAMKAWRFGLLLLAILAPQLVVRAQHLHPLMLGQLLPAWRFPRSELADVLRHLKQPGDTIALWGWDPNLAVQAELPIATRDPHTYRHIMPHALRDTYYRPRFLAELQAAEPAFFVDTVGPGSFQFLTRHVEGHETWPELAGFVAERYTYVGDFHPNRLYLHRDRAGDLTGLRAALAQAARRRPPPEEQGLPALHLALVPGRPLRMVEGRQVSMMEPPAQTVLELQGDESSLLFDYGQQSESYERPDQSDGVLFRLTLEIDGRGRTRVWERQLDPFHVVADRGTQHSEIPLPAHPPGSRLILETSAEPSGNGGWDWAYALNLRFRRQPLLNPDLFPGDAP